MIKLDKDIIANNVKVLRATTGLSVRALASELDINSMTISKLENKYHDISLETAILLCNYFDIGLEELLFTKIKI